MINLFKRNQPNVVLFSAFIGILLWVPLFIFKPAQVEVGYQFSGLTGNLYEFLGEKYFLRNILSFLLVFLISALLSRLNTRFLFINFRTQMPGYWFILLTAPFVYIFDIFPILLASTCTVLGLGRLFESYDKKGMSYELIDSGFLISFGSLFYPPILFLHLFLIVSLAALQGYSWKEWLLIIIGGVIPFSVVWGIAYTFETAFQEAFQELFVRNRNIPDLNLAQRIFTIGIGVLIFLASVQMVSVFNLKKINSRKLFSSLFVLFVISVIISIALARIEVLIISLAPLTYLFTHYFYLFKRQKLGVILFYIILLFSAASITNTILPLIE